MSAPIAATVFGAPENTLPALVAAAERGATVCEIDVVLTRDEEIVLMHDEVPDRTTNGRGLVADYDLAALRRLDAGSWFDTSFAGTPVPTLAEALVRHGPTIWACSWRSRNADGRVG
jgi:glycerophosphoryl diester phosphodiesterase